ncbi:unnamed protein product [Ostreobium quekettii]|uniref:Uncharacterized protein n=1 Tax=Ostreobium quekettii TaxID=121088 RepID=A0A8S1JBD7_9CHLO|nr:unnamed protein product [Ostreobium quekettii]
MVEACQARPTGRMPGYGRQLVPFFSEAAEGAGQPLEHRARVAKKADAPRPEGRRQNKRRSPRKGSPRNGSPRNGAFNPGRDDDRAAHGRQSPPAPAGGKARAEDRAAQRKKAAAAASSVGEALVPRVQDRRCQNYGSRACARADATFAGPGYFLSPPPEALPMPTASLLSRAMAVSY